MPAGPPRSDSLPPGVTRGLWDYVHTEAIAEDYDDYFAANRLFDFDEQVVARRLGSPDPVRPALVADLGCGAGRSIVALGRRGFRGLAVDLSEPMLRVVRRKSQRERLAIQCVQANLVQLDAIADHSVDHAILLFSTLGMIHGRENRHRVLRHVRRILKPGGFLVLHVHNFWYNASAAGGAWRLVGRLIRAAIARDIEAGDRCFDYRGVPQMHLHVFRLGELRRRLRRAGFGVEEVIPLSPPRCRPLRWPWLLGRLRANGWIVTCR